MTQPASHPLQVQADEFRQMILDDLNKGQNKIFEGLVLNIEVKKLPENIFRDYFLQGFLGKHPNPRWAAEWIGVAGNPSAEVAIVDHLGQELFLVPPLVASTSMLLNKYQIGAARVNDILNHSGNIAQNSPMQAMVFMTSALGQKTNEFVVQNTTDSIVVRWQQIFQRYGVLPPTTEATPAVSAPGEDPLFDYS